MALEEFRDLALEARRHPMFIAALCGAGVPGTDPSIIGPHVGSLAEVGRHFGVSERTAASWISAGATEKTERGYSIPHLDYWRKEQQGEQSQNVHELIVTGLLRAVTYEMSLAFAGFAQQVDDPNVVEKLLAFIDSELNGLLMLDEEFIQGVALELSGGSFFDRIMGD